MEIVKQKDVMENTINQKTQTIRTKVLMNHFEAWHNVETFRDASKEEHIVFVEGFRQEGTKILNADSIKKIKKKISVQRTNYPNIDIIPIFQFNAGSIRTIKDLNAISLCEVETGYNSLYEFKAKQSSIDYDSQLNTFKVSEKSLVVFEVNSKELMTKLTLALAKGIKNIVILGVGNKYSNLAFWGDLVNQIAGNDASLTVVLLKRMNKVRESYIKGLTIAGVNFLVHGALPPPRGKIQTLFLDSKMNYKLFEELSDENLKKQILNCEESKRYSLSRALTIKYSNLFAKSNPTELVIHN